MNGTGLAAPCCPKGSLGPRGRLRAAPLRSARPLGLRSERGARSMSMFIEPVASRPPSYCGRGAPPRALADGPLLDRAFAWLCEGRRHFPQAADIWSFRRRWPEEKTQIQAELLSGRFRFGLLRRVTLEDGSEIDLWSPRNALS